MVSGRCDISLVILEELKGLCALMLDNVHPRLLLAFSANVTSEDN